MKTLWNSTNYNNDLKLTRSDAEACSCSGDNEDAVNNAMAKPYLKKQLDALDPAQLAKELREFGAWDEVQLSNHADNLQRWVWISAGDIAERN